MSFRAKPAPVRHEFSNTQVTIPGWHALAMRKMGNRIPDAELAPDGRETEPHITAHFGLSDEKPPAHLKKALAKFGPVTAKLGRTSLFRNDDADVVKIDVDSPDLHRLHTLIKRTVPTPGNSHPTYVPHATIAYLKPGKGDKYAKDGTLHGQSVTFDHVVFSGKNGHMEKMPLGEKAKPGFRAN